MHDVTAMVFHRELARNAPMSWTIGSNRAVNMDYRTARYQTEIRTLVTMIFTIFVAVAVGVEGRQRQ